MKLTIFQSGQQYIGKRSRSHNAVLKALRTGSRLFPLKGTFVVKDDYDDQFGDNNEGHLDNQ